MNSVKIFDIYRLNVVYLDFHFDFVFGRLLATLMPLLERQHCACGDDALKEFGEGCRTLHMCTLWTWFRGTQRYL